MWQVPAVSVCTGFQEDRRHVIHDDLVLGVARLVSSLKHIILVSFNKTAFMRVSIKCTYDIRRSYASVRYPFTSRS